MQMGVLASILGSQRTSHVCVQMLLQFSQAIWLRDGGSSCEGLRRLDVQ